MVGAGACLQVLESPMTAKHLIISLGEKTFLSLPKRGMIVEGHCLIMPLESVVSSRECDEDVYNEFTRFKKQLQAMFFATNKSEVRERTSCSVSAVDSALLFMKSYVIHR